MQGNNMPDPSEWLWATIVGCGVMIVLANLGGCTL